MNSKQILDALEIRFSHNKMDIREAFIFNEESDFLTITSDDLAHEIEVKISRSDFKADFKKSKHLFFKALMEHKKMICIAGAEKNATCSIEPIHNAQNRYLSTLKLNYRGRKIEYVAPKFHFHEWSCSVRFVDVKNTRFPSKFSFAVPTGLISKDEIPDYAGLYYVNEFGVITEVKRAKFLHKEKFNKWKDFCSKFYWRNIDLKRRNEYLRHEINKIQR